MLQLRCPARGCRSSSSTISASTSCGSQLATVQGASIPNAYGGKQPQIQVDLDTDALQAKGLSPTDVVNAVSLQNLILPGGTSKIGGIEYDVRMNSSPDTVAELNDLPIKTGQRRRRSTSATSPTSATAPRRRPTSCASTASARRCCR